MNENMYNTLIPEDKIDSASLDTHLHTEPTTWCS